MTEFHPAQREAIEHRDGPMMVLAGPGSGKTTVVTHRVRNLTASCGADPSRILVVTFTRAAAREMRERFLKLTGETSTAVSFGTFHSVFFAILKHAYRYRAADIVREEQRIRFLREMVGEMGLEVGDTREFVSAVLGEISFVKSEMLDPDFYYSRNCSGETFKRLYRGYEERLRAAGLLDFDDMLVMCYRLFTEREDILAAWQRKFRYILVDEFQDISRVQYEIVRMLARPEDNLFIVGDDDQSVYRFRGSKPEIMLGFPRDYPRAGTVLLGVNYRSTAEIVETACRLIAHNRKRYDKKLEASRGHGRPVVTRGFEDPRRETMCIVEEIRAYARAGYRLEDIAILYRTNLNPRLMAEKLMEYNLPFSMKDALPNLYDHWIARDVLAYIRAASGDMSRGTILRIINRPNRYVSRDALEDTRVSWDRVKSFYRDRGWMVERIKRLEHDLRALRFMSPERAVLYIRGTVGYDGYLKEYARLRGLDPGDLLEILDQLQESAAGHATAAEWLAHMEEYKRRMREQARNRETKPEGVTLMTMHGSKGLEFPIVYILDANEGITPHQKAVLEADLEEERRMFYVAMTRARDRLHVYYALERYGRRQEPSRFVGEYLGTDGPGGRRDRR